MKATHPHQRTRLYSQARELLTILIYLILSPHTWAQGVAAGTSIINTVTVTYSPGRGATYQETREATATFEVDELINLSVVSLDTPAVVVPTPATERILSFQLTNTGNGNETFSLASMDISAADDFNPQVSGIWLESNGHPGLQSTDTPYVASNNDPHLAADESQIIYILSAIPAGLATDDEGHVKLIASSLTANIATISEGGTLNGVGDHQTDVVSALNYGNSSATGKYTVSPVQLNLRKTVASIEDPYGGDELLPQAKVTYQINIDVIGHSDNVDDIIIQDTTPAHMTYVPSSLTLDGAVLSDLNDNDQGDFNHTLPDTLTVDLGTLSPPASHVVTATFIIN